ncbi:MAG: hypothetical protein ABIW94_02775 [Gemmatimonadaceae bacterium]
MVQDLSGRPQKGEWNVGEFDSFLDEIAPSLEESVGRLGIAGHLGTRERQGVIAKLILSWPEASDRIVEEFR